MSCPTSSKGHASACPHARKRVPPLNALSALIQIDLEILEVTHADIETARLVRQTPVALAALAKDAELLRFFLKFVELIERRLLVF